jgi:hypothetical protein
VDGHLTLVGSDRAALFAAIRRAAATPKPSFDLAWARTDEANAERRLSVSLADNPSASGADVYLAVVEDGLVSQVTRGENEGRSLAHAAVTRRLERIGKTSSSGGFRGSVVVDSVGDPAATRVVVFAQRGAGRVVAIGRHRWLDSNDR